MLCRKKLRQGSALAAEWQLREEAGTELVGDPGSLSVISRNWLLSHKVLEWRVVGIEEEKAL